MSDPAEVVGHNVQCTRCGLIYHNPVMSRGEMLAYYSRDFAGEYHESRAMQEELAQARMNYLRARVGIDAISPVLEIGCAYGDFIASLNDAGVDAVGLEASERLARIARRDRKVKVMQAAIEEVDLEPEHYGMVAMFHVLEHFYDPVAVLKKIHHALHADAYLYLEVPTVAETQLAQVFKMIHPTTFVASTLRLMLDKCGFSVCDIEARGYNLVALASKKRNPTSAVALPCPDQIYREVERYISQRQMVLACIHKKMRALADKKKIAIYGAGHNTLDLNALYPIEQLPLDSIYDADPAKQGNTLLSKMIQPPRALRDFTGDAVIISTYKYQEEVLRDLSYLRRRGVELVTLYEK